MTIEQLKKDYGDDLKVVYKHYIVHPQSATIPAEATCAADQQGKFVQYEKAVWDKLYKTRKFDKASMEGLAGELGLNMDKFKKDMAGKCKALVKKDHSELARVGARGTPAFFINGRFISGAQPIGRFKSIIDEELKKANERIKKESDTTVENYYAKWVLAKGKKSL